MAVLIFKDSKIFHQIFVKVNKQLYRTVIKKCCGMHVADRQLLEKVVKFNVKCTEHLLIFRIFNRHNKPGFTVNRKRKKLGNRFPFGTKTAYPVSVLDTLVCGDMIISSNFYNTRFFYCNDNTNIYKTVFVVP